MARGKVKPPSIIVAELEKTKIAILVSRILSKCIHRPSHIMGTPCYEWTASLCNKGYAQFAWRTAGKWCGKRAHIFMWEAVRGRPVRDGYTLDHRCLNTACVRPEHLEEITREANTARGNRTRHGYAAEPESVAAA